MRILQFPVSRVTRQKRGDATAVGALLALFVFVLVSLGSHTAVAQTGNTRYPIWSDLSYFEREAIAGRSRAEAGDPDALLALYLVASGVRDLAGYETVNKRVGDFLRQQKEALRDSDDLWQTGKLLNQEMHRAFFINDADKPQSAYSVDQSRLMGIFETGEYNCISSALLYSVLLRHFDIQAKGVILPSHAFIELQLPGNRQVEVETTSQHGYDQEHDQAFYEKNNQQWFNTRGLQPATYDDYLQRQHISLTQLAARNMLNQHTAVERMSAEDGARLAEISALLDPAYALAQEKRIYFYNREIHRLIINKQWPQLYRLFATTYDSVLHGASQHRDVSSLQRAVQMYLSGAMLAYAQMGEIELTLEAMGELLNRDWDLSESREEQEKRVTSAVGLLLQHLVDKKQFDEAQLVLSLTEAHIQNIQPWQDMTRWLYLRWADQHWQEKRWEDVIFTLKDLQHMSPAEDQRHPLEMIESAYFNWVLELTQRDDTATADGVVEQCRVQIEDTRRCDKAAKLLRQAKN